MNQLKTVLLLGVLSAALVAVGGLVSPGALGLFLALAVAMNVGAYLWSDRIVLRLHGAREVSPAEAPGLHALVDELCRGAGLPRPRVCVIDDQHPNAFATGRGPRRAAVAVTTGLLRLLDERELRGVLAHELAHVKNRDVLVATVAATLAAVVTHAAHALGFAAMLGGGQEEEEGAGGGLLFALLAPLGAMLVQMGISRSREFMADESGARLTGDPLVLASALEKLHAGAGAVPSAAPVPATASLFIVSPFTGAGSALLRWFSTHPPAEERIARLRALAGEIRRPAFAPRAGDLAASRLVR
ncbi:MAG TPA: M48 family metalloprotease [Anaeromyxobacteraceae bacterium]|nr:M48 family metalloprotease [Anaeromyxobacteraceae bacterium]